jgi:hypothetical protein
MDADFVRNRLFQPFASTKQNGFGIGAFEARSLIHAMGGRLSVDSRPGRHRFTITLPPPSPAEPPRCRKDAHDRPPTLPVLLVVEDDEGLQRQLKWAYDGYRVVSAGDRAGDRGAAPARARGGHARPRPAARSRRHHRRLRDVLAEILRLKPDTKVIVASGHGARESALRPSRSAPTTSTASRSTSTSSA